MRPTDQPAHIPTSPGVYQFTDASGTLLYVGKAKNLRARLSSYFADPATLHPRTATMVDAASSLTWLELPSELDALLVEQHLIATNQPRFNVRLKDDSSYPYVALTRDVPTRVFITRNRSTPNVTLHGPYPKTPNLRASLEELCAQLGIATCRVSTFATARRTKKPCLLYDIKRCSGPCANKIDDEAYQAAVQTLADTLDGRSDLVTHQLQAQMHQQAAARHYEAAALTRNVLESIRSITEPSYVVGAPSLSADVVALSSAVSFASVTWIQVRSGRITGYSSFELSDLPLELLTTSTTPADLLALALTQIYATADVPALVLVPELPSDAHRVREFLASRASKTVTLSVPTKGPRYELVQSALTTSATNLARRQLRRAVDVDSRSQALRDLATALSLPRIPLRMECYDMAHLQGTSYVGSMVVFDDGLAKKSHYRTFKLRTVPGNNDLAAMREVLTRRLSRYLEATDASSETASLEKGRPDESFSARPDLLVIDGGPTQLAVVVDVLEQLGLKEEIPVVSLAKRLEEVYLPGQDLPVMLESSSEALYLFQRLRDEAHRVANSTHAKLRAKTMTKSALETVKGLGPSRRERLLGEMGSFTKLLEASLDDLYALAWLPRSVAGDLYATLHTPTQEPTARENP